MVRKKSLTISPLFSADTSQWIRADFAVELMRHVSVGPGVKAIKPVFLVTDMRHNKLECLSLAILCSKVK
jgi:hypothetical protein